MRFWLEFFTSKEFSFDFKIANLIMRDALRNYMAVDRVVLKEVAESESLSEFQKRKLLGVVHDLDVLMHNE